MQQQFYSNRMIWAQMMIFALLCVTACASYAQDFSQCSSQFYQQTSPKLVRSSLKSHTYRLCFSGFAVLYSGVSRTPLWSAELLSPERLKQAKGLGRQGEFYEEPRVEARHRSLLKDYARSGYDRGHMAPNGDMANRTQQSDSFSLANMVPQSPKNNQEVWRNLEEATRALVLKKRTSAYILTGPVYLGDRVSQVGRVLVPSDVYKAVYFPQLKIASAYFAPNDESGDLQVISVAELEQIIGINLFPAMSAQVKNTLVRLPKNAKEANKASFDFTDVSPYTTKNARQSHQHHSTETSTTSDSPVEIEKNLAEEVKYQFLKWIISKLSKEY
jgi:endonuclease G